MNKKIVDDMEEETTNETVKSVTIPASYGKGRLSIKAVTAWMTVEEVRLSGDSTLLIDYLRRDDYIPEEMRRLIADILDGTIKARPIKPTRAKRLFDIRHELRLLVKTFRSFLKDLNDGAKFIDLGDGEKLEWQQMKCLLTASGYTGNVDTKGEITEAAKHIVAYKLEITLSELDEAITNRRRKSGRY